MMENSVSMESSVMKLTLHPSAPSLMQVGVTKMCSEGDAIYPVECLGKGPLTIGVLLKIDLQCPSDCKGHLVQYLGTVLPFQREQNVYIWKENMKKRMMISSPNSTILLRMDVNELDQRVLLVVFRGKHTDGEIIIHVPSSLESPPTISKTMVYQDLRL